MEEKYSEEKIKCAIIGLGRIASTLEDDILREKPATHAGAVTASKETVLAAGCDSDPEACKDFSNRWGIQAMYSDAETMLREINPDILHIATHEDSHLKYLALAVKENVPVVILEKPLSHSLYQARRMAGKLGLTRVLVNHERRYSLDYISVREHIRKETYGRLLSVNGRLYMGIKRSIKDMLLHDGTHLLDIIPYLTDSPLKKLRVMAGGKKSHSIYARAQCGEIPVSCEFGNYRDHLVFELELSFSEGRIRVGNGIYEEWESRESTYYEGMRSLYPVITKPPVMTMYFSGMLEDAVRVLKDPEIQAVSSFSDGVESLSLVQKLRRVC